ncbi:hypothetical protein [Sphingomonas faeni]
MTLVVLRRPPFVRVKAAAAHASAILLLSSRFRAELREQALDRCEFAMGV